MSFMIVSGMPLFIFPVYSSLNGSVVTTRPSTVFLTLTKSHEALLNSKNHFLSIRMILWNPSDLSHSFPDVTQQEKLFGSAW